MNTTLEKNIDAICVKIVSLENPIIHSWGKILLPKARRLGSIIDILSEPHSEVRDLLQVMYRDIIYQPLTNGWFGGERSILWTHSMRYDVGVLENQGRRMMDFNEAELDPEAMKISYLYNHQPMRTAITVIIRFHGEKRKINPDDYQREVKGWISYGQTRRKDATVNFINRIMQGMDREEATRAKQNTQQRSTNFNIDQLVGASKRKTGPTNRVAPTNIALDRACGKQPDQASTSTDSGSTNSQVPSNSTPMITEASPASGEDNSTRREASSTSKAADGSPLDLSSPQKSTSTEVALRRAHLPTPSMPTRHQPVTARSPFPPSGGKGVGIVATTTTPPTTPLPTVMQLPNRGLRVEQVLAIQNFQAGNVAPAMGPPQTYFPHIPAMANPLSGHPILASLLITSSRPPTGRSGTTAATATPPSTRNRSATPNVTTSRPPGNPEREILPALRDERTLHSAIPPRVGGIPLTTVEDVRSAKTATFGVPASPGEATDRSPSTLREWRRSIYSDAFETILPEHARALRSYLPFLGAATRGEVVETVKKRCAFNLKTLQVMGRITTWDYDQWVTKGPVERETYPDKQVRDLLKRLAYIVVGPHQISQHTQGVGLERHQEIKATCAALLIHMIEWIKEIGEEAPRPNIAPETIPTPAPAPAPAPEPASTITSEPRVTPPTAGSATTGTNAIPIGRTRTPSSPARSELVFEINIRAPVQLNRLTRGVNKNASPHERRLWHQFMEVANDLRVWIALQRTARYGKARLAIIKLVAAIMAEEILWIQEKIGHYFSAHHWEGPQEPAQQRRTTYIKNTDRMWKILDNKIPSMISQVHAMIMEMFELRSTSEPRPEVTSDIQAMPGYGGRTKRARTVSARIPHEDYSDPMIEPTKKRKRVRRVIATVTSDRDLVSGRGHRSYRRKLTSDPSILIEKDNVPSDNGNDETPEQLEVSPREQEQDRSSTRWIRKESKVQEQRQDSDPISWTKEESEVQDAPAEVNPMRLLDERERIILKVKRCDVQYPDTNVCNPQSNPQVSIRRDKDLDDRAVREAIQARARNQEVKKLSNLENSSTDDGHSNLSNSNSNRHGNLSNSNGNSNEKQKQESPSRKRKVASMSTTGPWSTPKPKYRTIWDPAGESDSSSEDNDYH